MGRCTRSALYTPSLLRDTRNRGHFPGAGAEAIRLGDQRTDRAQVDHVARHLVVNGRLYVSPNLHLLATADHAELLDAGDLFRKPDAARALNAAGHVGRDERSDILVRHDALALVETRDVAAKAYGQILQLAFAALIADGTVERVIDEEEFHRRPLRTDRARGLREDLHSLGDRRRTRRQRLRSLLHLDETHAAIGRNRQLLVVAEARDIGALRVGGADEHLALARLDGHAVDLDVDEFVGHVSKPP
jgi:hypothetical protein